MDIFKFKNILDLQRQKEADLESIQIKHDSFVEKKHREKNIMNNDVLSYELKKKELNTLIRNLSKTLGDHQTQIDNSKKEKEELQHALFSIEKKLIEKEEELKTILNSIETKKYERNVLKDISKIEKSDSTIKIDLLQEQIKTLKLEYADYDNKINEYKELNTKFVQLKEEYNSLENLNESLVERNEREKVLLSSERTKLEKERKELNEQKEEFLNNFYALEKKEATLVAWEKRLLKQSNNQ